jgi:hypothetical protein
VDVLARAFSSPISLCFGKDTCSALPRLYHLIYSNIITPVSSHWQDKQKLANEANITEKQVCNWFTNARKRLWQPALIARGITVDRTKFPRFHQTASALRTSELIQQLDMRMRATNAALAAPHLFQLSPSSVPADINGMLLQSPFVPDANGMRLQLPLQSVSYYSRTVNWPTNAAPEETCQSQRQQ